MTQKNCFLRKRLYEVKSSHFLAATNFVGIKNKYASIVKLTVNCLSEDLSPRQSIVIEKEIEKKCEVLIAFNGLPQNSKSATNWANVFSILFCNNETIGE